MTAQPGDQETDAGIRSVFRVEPQVDRSGMLRANPNPPDEQDEEELFAMYMRRYFPQAAVEHGGSHVER
jgi:hypothetical protein